MNQGSVWCLGVGSAAPVGWGVLPGPGWGSALPLALTPRSCPPAPGPLLLVMPSRPSPTPSAQVPRDCGARHQAGERPRHPSPLQ